MKKIAIIGLLSLGLAGAAYAQGTLVFNNNAAGTVVAHIWSPDPTTPNVQTTGNGSIDTPVGATVYNGMLIGGATGTEPSSALSAPYTASTTPSATTSPRRFMRCGPRVQRSNP